MVVEGKINKLLPIKGPDEIPCFTDWSESKAFFRKFLEEWGIDPKTRIRSATKPFLLPIGRSHIQAAVPKDPLRCVVSLSGKDHCKHRITMAMAQATVWIINWDEMTMLKYVVSSKKLMDAIKNFDLKKGWSLQPGTYCLRPPTGNNKLKKDMTESEAANRKKTNESLERNSTYKSENGLPPGKRDEFRPRILTRVWTRNRVD